MTTPDFETLRGRVQALGCVLLAAPAGLEASILDPVLGELTMMTDDLEAWLVGRRAAAGAVPADATAWLAGADIAIDLLEEGAEVGLDEMAMQDDCRSGRPQVNVFLKHLDRLRALNNRTSDVAFSAVMSEFVGLYADALSMQLLVNCSRRPIATTAGD